MYDKAFWETFFDCFPTEGSIRRLWTLAEGRTQQLSVYQKEFHVEQIEEAKNLRDLMSA